MKKYKVTRTETIYYEKIIEAENKDEAYNTFLETKCEDDIIESVNEADDIEEVEDE
jgi:hypothetical protein